MIKKDYIFPYQLHDGDGKCVRWEGDKLSMTFFRYYVDENTPNKIDVIFHGVDWVRTTNLIKYPCPADEWDVYSYDPNKPIEDYLKVERDWLNDDYEEFMSGNGSSLETVCCIEDNVVFIDDRLIFSCTDIEIVEAICEKNIMKVEKRAVRKFDSKYHRKPYYKKTRLL